MSSLMGSLLCTLSLLWLEAFPRPEPTLLSLGRIRPLALLLLMVKLRVNDKGPMPEGTHTHRMAQVSQSTPGLSIVPRTVSPLALWLRGALARLIGHLVGLLIVSTEGRPWEGKGSAQGHPANGTNTNISTPSDLPHWDLPGVGTGEV